MYVPSQDLLPTLRFWSIPNEENGKTAAASVAIWNTELGLRSRTLKWEFLGLGIRGLISLAGL